MQIIKLKPKTNNQKGVDMKTYKKFIVEDTGKKGNIKKIMDKIRKFDKSASAEVNMIISVDGDVDLEELMNIPELKRLDVGEGGTPSNETRQTIIVDFSA